MRRTPLIQATIAVLGLSLLAMIIHQRRDGASDLVDKIDVLQSTVGADSPRSGAKAVELVPSAGAMTRDEDGEIAKSESSGDVTEQLSEPDIIAALQTLTIAESMGQIENLIQQLAAKNYGAALTFAREQPAGFARERLMERIAFVHAQGSPEGAARLVMEEIAPGPRQSEAAMMVLHQWALRDSHGAAAWVELFPEGALKERAERELTGIKTAGR